MFSKSELSDKLISLCGYSNAGAASLAEKCMNMPEELQRIVRGWLDTGNEPDLEREGYSVKGLMEERGFSYINALNVIWWLERDPKAAIAALKRPTDRIVREKPH